jgi:hypothetical protein
LITNKKISYLNKSNNKNTYIIIKYHFIDSNMEYTNKQIIILLSIIFVSILVIIFLYNYFVKGKISIEKFENAIDLLNKHKSSNVQLTGDNTSSDIELSINPWTTKLKNMQEQQKVKPIALYKPLLVINGEKYSKLGDMISVNTDYSPPNNNEFALLIKRSGSNIKAPLNYNLIVNFGNSNLPSYYYQYDRFLDSQNNLSLVMNNINNCFNAISNLNQILSKNQYLITNQIKNIIKTQTHLRIGSSNPISLASIINMSVLGNSSSGIIQTPISASTDILLPIGTDASILTPDNQFSVVWESPININTNITANSLLQTIQPNSIFRNFTAENIIINSTSSINIFSLTDTNDIVEYLQKLCNDILTIFGQTNIKPEFIKYLNLGDSLEGVNTVLSAISTLQQNKIILPGLEITTPNNTNKNNTMNNIIANNTVLNAYANANTNTLLGGILNIIINKSQTYNYPCIKFKPNQLALSTRTSNSSIMSVINGISDANGIIINNFSSSILDNIVVNISSNSHEIANLTTNVLPNLSKMFEFQTALNSGNIDFFPLQIYEPIAPPNYKALGHVFCNTAKDFYKLSTANNVACVPEQCVKEIRDWVSSDKVFEYNQSGVYWALFKNPYTGTFIAVNQPQLPSGKVCKVVACVAKCNAIDELQKADECARKYYQINKSIAKNTTETPDFVGNTEESIYLEKIKQQSDNITRLEKRAQQMQITIDKADIVNTEMNKSKLQDYVDTQKRNIDLVVKQLEKDQNKISANINIPVSALNNLISMIKNVPTLTPEQKQKVISKIIQNATQLSNNTITSGQYNTNLNQILKSCPQYDLTGLVKKDLVSNVCYGCGSPE